MLTAASVYGVDTAQISNGLSAELSVVSRFTDRSFRANFTNDTPLFPYGRVLPSSDLSSLLGLRFAWNKDGQSVVEGRLVAEKKNRLIDRVMPTEDSLYQGAKTVEAQRDLSSWNALQNDSMANFTDLWIDRLSVRNLVVLDEVTLGSRLRLDWGDYVLKRDFQGLTMRKTIAFGDGGTLGFEAMAASLYGVDRLSRAQAGKLITDELGFLAGVRARLQIVSNQNLLLAGTYAFLKQSRVFFSAAGQDASPSIRNFYLKIRSTADYRVNDPTSSSYPVMFARTARAITYLDDKGRTLRSLDANPEDEGILADSRSILVYRAITRSSERSGSEVVFSSTPKIAGNNWYVQYTNHDYFRQCDELTPGLGDYYRGEINLVFPMSGDSFRSQDIRSIRVRFNVNYNYAYSVSFDGMTWKDIDVASMRAVDASATRRDLGNGLVMEQSDPLNLYDESWYGVNPAADPTQVPPPRETGFDFAMNDAVLLQGRDQHAISFQLALPRIGTRLGYEATALRSIFYAGSNTDALAQQAKWSQRLFDDRLQIDVAVRLVDPGFGTGFAPLGRGGVTSPLENGLIEDREGPPYAGALDLSDIRRRWVSGYRTPTIDSRDRILLPAEFMRLDLDNDENGNGFDDRFENDLNPDVPMQAGRRGYQARVAWTPDRAVHIEAQSRLSLASDGGTRDEAHRLSAMVELHPFYADALVAILRDEVRDDLMYQIFNVDGPTNVSESGVWASDLMPNRKREYVRLGVGLRLNGEAGHAAFFRSTNDLHARLETFVDRRLDSASVGAALRGEWISKLPFRFALSLFDFTPELQTQLRLGLQGGRPADFAFGATFHLVKHFGPIDLTGGLGLVDMNSAPFYFKNRYGIGMLAVSFRLPTFSLSFGWHRIAPMENLAAFGDQFSGDLRTEVRF